MPGQHVTLSNHNEYHCPSLDSQRSKHDVKRESEVGTRAQRISNSTSKNISTFSRSLSCTADFHSIFPFFSLFVRVVAERHVRSVDRRKHLTKEID